MKRNIFKKTFFIIILFFLFLYFFYSFFFDLFGNIFLIKNEPEEIFVEIPNKEKIFNESIFTKMNVVLRPDKNFYDSAIFFKDNKQIKEDELIFNFFRGNFWAIGKNKFVSDDFSKISFFSAFGQKNIFVLKDEENETFFDVEGFGTGSGEIEVFISREIPISKKSELLISFDEDYKVGIFSEEVFKDEDPDKKIIFKIGPNLDQLSEVYIKNE